MDFLNSQSNYYLRGNFFSAVKTGIFSVIAVVIKQIVRSGGTRTLTQGCPNFFFHHATVAVATGKSKASFTIR
ncbi:hypothetical protein HanPI659440_Chr14g0558051 [Helianthus annuus]|nr:hypothetical protein HanPI659440_Chr14g0558051 [Helianthus annuus]